MNLVNGYVMHITLLMLKLANPFLIVNYGKKGGKMAGRVVDAIELVHK